MSVLEGTDCGAEGEVEEVVLCDFTARNPLLRFSLWGLEGK